MSATFNFASYWYYIICMEFLCYDNNVWYVLCTPVLPFIKNAEENVTFAMYFSRQWQDTMFLSLHNFLSVVLSTMRILDVSEAVTTYGADTCSCFCHQKLAPMHVIKFVQFDLSVVVESFWYQTCTEWSCILFSASSWYQFLVPLARVTPFSPIVTRRPQGNCGIFGNKEPNYKSSKRSASVNGVGRIRFCGVEVWEVVHKNKQKVKLFL